MSAPVTPLEPVATVLVRPTWLAAVQICIMALENGTPAGKQMAREELQRMGRILDSLADEKGGV